MTSEVMAAIRGEQRAVQFLTVLRGILGDGNELERALTVCPADERRAFLAAIQRTLEGRPR